MTTPPAQPVTGIAFDLDGTLVDSAADIARAVNEMLAGHGLPAQSTSYVEQFIGHGPRELIAGVLAGMGVAADDERVDRDTAAYQAAYAAAPVVESRLYGDALPALTALHDAGVRIGVCTNKTQAMAEQVLRHLGLGEIVDVVVGGDALPVRKPDPQHLLVTLERMGTPVSQALFVGDTAIDAETAQRAGVPCVLVDWAPSGDAALRLSTFAELLDLVASRDEARTA